MNLQHQLAHYPSIDLVVIGLNSMSSLSKIYTEDYVAEISDIFFCKYYVDTGSSDGSQDYMRSIGFHVIQAGVNGSSASLGRHVGAKVANSDFICYLDSDMKLRNVENFRKVNLSKIKTGLVGSVCDIYPNGDRRMRRRRIREIADSFGGFLIIRRQDVIEVGNWSLRLKANEELDLHIRLLSRRKLIHFDISIAVDHYTFVSSQFAEFISMYLPTRPHRFGALGRVIKQLQSRNDAISFLKLQPEIPLFILIFVFSQVMPLVAAFAAYCLFFIYVSQRRSWKYNFIVPALIINILVGMFIDTPELDGAYEKI